MFRPHRDSGRAPLPKAPYGYAQRNRSPPVLAPAHDLYPLPSLRFSSAPARHQRPAVTLPALSSRARNPGPRLSLLSPPQTLCPRETFPPTPRSILPCALLLSPPIQTDDTTVWLR